MNEKPFWKNEPFFVIFLIGICLLLFFFRLGYIPLGDADEAMHAVSSKDMVLSGDWIIPKLYGENFYDKAPLYNWLAAVAFIFWELTSSLPVYRLLCWGYRVCFSIDLFGCKKYVQGFYRFGCRDVYNTISVGFIYILPLLGPLVSCKELALKLNKLMTPGDSIRFYNKPRASVLFYTDRSGEVLENSQQLMAYFSSRKNVYCVFKYDDWQDVESLHGSLQVVVKIYDKLIVYDIRDNLSTKHLYLSAATGEEDIDKRSLLCKFGILSPPKRF